jgi:ATP-dependent RNA helicase DDX55/SPB4
VGRTARAGKLGCALLFITEEERAYAELLRGRGVPLVEKDKQGEGEEEGDAMRRCGTILAEIKALASKDRDLLETGSTAFMSYLRAYQVLNETPFVCYSGTFAFSFSI